MISSLKDSGINDLPVHNTLLKEINRTNKLTFTWLKTNKEVLNNGFFQY